MNSPEDQKVTFVELFFDLVFVFAVTQIVVLLHDDLSSQTIIQAIVIFWLVWWSWTQFTWTLNAADTTHPFIEFMTLVTTAIAFLMATSIPRAFEDRAPWFAIPYILTRIIGIYLQIKIAKNDNIKKAARGWARRSSIGFVLVLIGGMIGGNTQYILWILTIFVDFWAAKGSQDTQDADGIHIYPEHFTERHGLIVIIALGESLIVAAGGIVNEDLDLRLITIVMLAVTMTCGLWWSYFVKVKPTLDKAMEQAIGSERAEMGRDAYSLFHFPMLCGIISYTLAIEEAIAHPSDPLSTEGNFALGLGLLLFVGGTTLAVWRATGHIMSRRIVLILVISTLIVAGIIPLHGLVLGLLGVLLIVGLEHKTFS